ncbi:MAG: hypothetical protein ACLP66_01435, partial [Polyangia bacterium]
MPALPWLPPISAIHSSFDRGIPAQPVAGDSYPERNNPASAAVANPQAQQTGGRPVEAHPEFSGGASAAVANYFAGEIPRSQTFGRAIDVSGDAGGATSSAVTMSGDSSQQQQQLPGLPRDVFPDQAGSA